jgi:hypothetical protein
MRDTALQVCRGEAILLPTRPRLDEEQEPVDFRIQIIWSLVLGNALPSEPSRQVADGGTLLVLYRQSVLRLGR